VWRGVDFWPFMLSCFVAFKIYIIYGIIILHVYRNVRSSCKLYLRYEFSVCAFAKTFLLRFSCVSYFVCQSRAVPEAKVCDSVLYSIVTGCWFLFGYITVNKFLIVFLVYFVLPKTSPNVYVHFLRYPVRFLEGKNSIK